MGFFFYKTGTLTYGKPRVSKVVSTDDKYSEDEILKYTALAEQQSEHLLGKAIWNAYVEKGGKNETVKGFKVMAVHTDIKYLSDGVSSSFKGEIGDRKELWYF